MRKIGRQMEARWRERRSQRRGKLVFTEIDAHSEDADKHVHPTAHRLLSLAQPASSDLVCSLQTPASATQAHVFDPFLFSSSLSSAIISHAGPQSSLLSHWHTQAQWCHDRSSCYSFDSEDTCLIPPRSPPMCPDLLNPPRSRAELLRLRRLEQRCVSQC